MFFVLYDVAKIALLRPYSVVPTLTCSHVSPAARVINQPDDVIKGDLHHNLWRENQTIAP